MEKDVEKTKEFPRGRSRRGGSSRLPVVRNDFALPDLGPSVLNNGMTNPVLGYAYKEDNFTKNHDRVQMMVRYYKFNLNGARYHDPDSDIALPTGNYFDYVREQIWPKEYLFNWWIQMAQKRDDYNPQANSLYDTTWNTIRDYLELLITAKTDAHVLWTLLHCTGRNQATQSYASTLTPFRRRIQNCLKNLNTLTYPAAFERPINYWQKVFMPYDGGPLIANLFMFDELNTDHSSGYNSWNNGNAPLLNDSTDMNNLVTNIERAVEELRGVNLATANRLTDYFVMQYHMNMVGITEPQTRAMPADVDLKKWEDQFIACVMSIRDETPSRTLLSNHVSKTDVDTQRLMVKQLGMDMDDWQGLTAPYAFISEQGDIYRNEASQWLVTAGIATPGYHADVLTPCSQGIMYTLEDKWSELEDNFDISEAAADQALIWKRPDLTPNRDFPVLIFQEEDEENYRQGFIYADTPNRAHVTVNHIAQGFAKFLCDAFSLPMYSG
jgi:hypothetical protein